MTRKIVKRSTFLGPQRSTFKVFVFTILFSSTQLFLYGELNTFFARENGVHVSAMLQSISLSDPVRLSEPESESVLGRSDELSAVARERGKITAGSSGALL